MARPPHLLLDNSIYFITCRTKDRIKFFNSDEKKKLIKEAVRRAVEKYNYKIFAWVILANHYHLLLKVSNSSKLSKFIQYINGSSSRWLHLLEDRLDDELNLITEDGLSVRPRLGQTDSLPSGEWVIWQNYWDRIIKDEKSFWTHFNYIHYNPVKHGYVKSMVDYQFSSYNHYLKTKGQDWLDSIFINYPVVDFYAGE